MHIIFPFPSQRSRQGKELYALNKNGAEGKIQLKVPERTGQKQVGRTWPGLGAGQGDWTGQWDARGTCMFLNKNVGRNRLEHSFRAVCQGKKPLFFTGRF